MPEEFDNYDALLSMLRILIRDRAPRIIGIEGYMAAGKTRLAHDLAKDLGAALVSTDDFAFATMHPDQPREHLKDQPYLKQLCLDALAASMGQRLSESPLVVVDGICLRDTLGKIGQSAGITVYVKCLSHNAPLWHPGFDLEDYEAGTARFTGLDHDTHEYHHRMRVHENADLVFIRVEESG